MRYLILLLVTGACLAGSCAYCQDVAGLAGCVTKVFREINHTGKWSGKPPAGCPVKLSVEKRPSGLFVTAWTVEHADAGWVRTAFSGAMDYGEIARKETLNRAGKDMEKRAGRLQRCLKSIVRVNDPLDCRDRATKSYLVDDESGIETKRLVWLDDNGRHTVVEYVVGATTATPTPPVDLFSGQQLPPGTIIDYRVK